jgi:hypothetical protein
MPQQRERRKSLQQPLKVVTFELVDQQQQFVADNHIDKPAI